MGTTMKDALTPEEYRLVYEHLFAELRRKREHWASAGLDLRSARRPVTVEERTMCAAFAADVLVEVMNTAHHASTGHLEFDPFPQPIQPHDGAE